MKKPNLSGRKSGGYDILTEKMKFIAIIPARYASTRFPGKPLAMLGGKPVIQRVYEQVAGVLDAAVVATDDRRIYEAVLAFGGRAEMTSPEHRSGTDRCWEAYCRQGEAYDAVVNVQGDEPFIRPEQLEAVCRCFDDPATDIATLVKPFAAEDGLAALENPNSPKVVLDAASRAVYFSRSVIPYLRGVPREEWLARHTFYKHIGLYAFRTEVLGRITALPSSTLERAESLEQLRWIENGYRIGVGITQAETVGIDTPEDLARAEEFLGRMNG
jgi:3-deoxy-manno-octulosonate cytidylyltransferase (CMP-KDO synthetase)